MLAAHRNQRPGFTLVELLIVVALISILLALGASATVRVIDVQRGNNTEQTVKIVSEHLDRHIVWVTDKASSPLIESLPPQLVSDVKSLGGNEELARVVYIKLRLRKEFPITFGEATAVVPYVGAHKAYQNALAGVSPTVRTSESSVCLLLSLQQSRGGLTLNPDLLGAGAITTADTSPARDLRQIVDGWAVPLAYYRWPIANAELNPGGADGQRGHNDPTDPKGLLAAPSVLRNTQFVTWFRKIGLHPLPQLASGSNPPAVSFKLIPVVASAGRNGKFGFLPDTPPFPVTPAFGIGDGTMRVNTANEDALDNVYSYRLRFGARGD